MADDLEIGRNAHPNDQIFPSVEEEKAQKEDEADEEKAKANLNALLGSVGKGLDDLHPRQWQVGKGGKKKADPKKAKHDKKV